MPEKDKRLIVLIGNCQNTVIAKFLLELPEISSQYQLVRFRNFDLKTAYRGYGGEFDSLDIPPAQFISNNSKSIAALLVQRTHNWEDPGLIEEQLAPDTTFVHYPVALLNYIWPFTYNAARSRNLNRKTSSFFPYTTLDSILFELVDRGVPADKIVEEYLSVDITKRVRLDRLRHINTLKMKQIEENSDFRIWDFVESRIGDEQVFRTENHPNGPLMALIIRGICERLPFIRDRQLVDYKLKKVAAGNGVQLIDAPVHPHIAAHFNLKWAMNGRFQFWYEGRDTFQQRLLRMYHLHYNRNLDAAQARIRDGDIAAATDLCMSAVGELPGSVKALDILVQCLRRGRRYREAAEFQKMAYELEPDGERAARVVDVLLRDRDLKQAETWLAAAMERYPDDVELAACDIKYARYKRSSAEMERALLAAEKTAPLDYRIHQGWGDWLRQRNDFAGAASRYERAYYLSNWSEQMHKCLLDVQGRLYRPTWLGWIKPWRERRKAAAGPSNTPTSEAQP